MLGLKSLLFKLLNGVVAMNTEIKTSPVKIVKKAMEENLSSYKGKNFYEVLNEVKKFPQSSKMSCKSRASVASHIVKKAS